jgi:hypothetical protein
LAEGHWLLAAGYWMLAAGYWLLAVVCWLLAIVPKAVSGVVAQLLLLSRDLSGVHLFQVRRHATGQNIVSAVLAVLMGT